MGQESETVQYLNVLWEAVQSLPSLARVNSEPARLLVEGYRRAQPEEQRAFHRGKRGELRRYLMQCHSRSGAYELAEAERLAEVLAQMDLVGSLGERPQDWRDRATHRPVMTRLREVARLHYDWHSEQARQWLRESWPAIISLPIGELKTRLRAMKRRPTE